MKCFVISIVILMTLGCYADAYSYFIPARVNLLGVCAYNGQFLKQGDNSIPSTCQNVHCNVDGSIIVEGCGHHSMDDCRVIDPMNLYKPYPECCKMDFHCANRNHPTLR